MTIRRQLAATLIAVPLIASLSGCQTGSTPSASNAPPAGAAVWQAGAPPAGTVAEIETNTDGSISTYTLEIVDVSEAAPGGPTILRGTTSDYAFASEAETGRIVEWSRIDGEPVRRSVSNDTGWLDAPLWAGKTWTQTYDFRDRERGRTWRGIETRWTVVGPETITTPAGTFDVLRLEGRPGRHNATTVTVWYEPELGLRIQRESERGSNHYRGRGKTTRRVIALDVPATAEPDS